ncbi:MAG: KamA family radical SAM protein [Proteobacteria bacterium]|nr:KamA family radical SAM protein [Pseudomonadota bacterium]
MTTLPFIHTVEELSKHLCLDKKTKEEIEKVSISHPFRIPKFYLDLMEKDNPLCPIRKQSVPSKEELTGNGDTDPLNEKKISLTPSFFKRYQNRGVFLASSDCAMYCRFCNRRRLIGKKWDARLHWEETFQYLERDRETHEVIISGGDPFMLSSDELDYILSRLRSIRSIKNTRISTRMPVVYPEGLKQGHFDALKKSSPLWIVIHINHPREVSTDFIETVNRLRDAGNIIISQTVLLRGVNDCPHVLARLFENLVYCGVKPYYLFQLDEVRGAGHFKVKLKKGVEIMRYLRANNSGLAIPQYALDITGGLGKVSVDYKYIKKRRGNKVIVEGLSGKTGIYNDDAKQSICSKCNICKQGLP